MRRIIVSLCALLTVNSFGQKDISGSNDSEFITRYPDSWIIQYSENEYDQYNIALSKKRASTRGGVLDKELIEGKRISIDYKAKEGTSVLLIHKNYENALTKKGFNVLFKCLKASCADGRTSIPYRLSQSNYIPKLRSTNPYIGDGTSYLTAQKVVNGKKVTVTVMSGYSEKSPSAGTQYRIDIIESKPLDLNKVSVSDISDKLKTEGKIALYGIQFDFNSANIKTESAETIKMIAAFLKNNPEVNVFVVGHTDNVGNFEKNISLSQNRAAAVVKKLIDKHGITSNRLTSKGIAMLSPLSSNTSDLGRKLNRRVEIVKK